MVAMALAAPAAEPAAAAEEGVALEKRAYSCTRFITNCAKACKAGRSVNCDGSYVSPTFPPFTRCRCSSLSYKNPLCRQGTFSLYTSDIPYTLY
jgi:hypothetical protein